jgi:hypothetical protein
MQLPYIKKEDVDFVTLPDDTVALWDLTVEIDDKTSIKDLYASKKTPLLARKIWRTTVGNNSNNYNYYQDNDKKNEANASACKKKEEEDKDKDKDKDSDGDFDGLVWSKSLDKYKTQKGIEETKKYKSVEIEVKEGGVIQIDSEGDETKNKSEEGNDISEVNEDKVENLITARAKLTEWKEKDKNDKNNKQTVIREVDMSQDPEALKKADDFVEEGIIKYESDDEVIDELELSDIAILKSLPVYALTNRIKKFVLKQGFMAGYICRKNEKENGSNNETNKILIKKLEKATKKISTIKTILKITSGALEKLTNPQIEKSINDTISDGIEKAKLNYETLSNAFSVGDLEKVVLLKKIKTKIRSINDQEKTHSAAV